MRHKFDMNSCHYCKQDKDAKPYKACSGPKGREHPQQPIVVDSSGVHRFKINSIVDMLLNFYTEETCKLNNSGGLNRIITEVFSGKYPIEDYEQLMQLIGYSVSGASDLSTMSDKVINKALRESHKLSSNKEKE